MGDLRGPWFVIAAIQVNVDQSFFHAAPNISSVSVSYLPKIGSNTDWSQEELELEIDKVLGGHLKVPPTV